MYFSAIGQDSHRFEPDNSNKPLILGGIHIPGCCGLSGNSDADVLLHALTNAISGVSGINILGKIADELCLKEGITDSRVYLERAIETISSYQIIHVSCSIEAARPRLSAHISAIRDSLARLLSIEPRHVCITATSGEGLTSFGRGEGIQAFVIVSVKEKNDS
ncbi:MAG: 2-C-methyl-D-erythritol 2,4-cyclodiphosphate synthase [Fibrobacter sp.]|nr:2-C-methyl-D-erythritol 2,4-cyclodiphosphate synthase [Fibrobacter sp.]